MSRSITSSLLSSGAARLKSRIGFLMKVLRVRVMTTNPGNTHGGHAAKFNFHLCSGTHLNIFHHLKQTDCCFYSATTHPPFFERKISSEFLLSLSPHGHPPPCKPKIFIFIKRAVHLLAFYCRVHINASDCSESFSMNRCLDCACVSKRTHTDCIIAYG